MLNVGALLLTSVVLDSILVSLVLGFDSSTESGVLKTESKFFGVAFEVVVAAAPFASVGSGFTGSFVSVKLVSAGLCSWGGATGTMAGRLTTVFSVTGGAIVGFGASATGLGTGGTGGATGVSTVGVTGGRGGTTAGVGGAIVGVLTGRLGAALEIAAGVTAAATAGFA